MATRADRHCQRAAELRVHDAIVARKLAEREAELRRLAAAATTLAQLINARLDAKRDYARLMAEERLALLADVDRYAN